MIQKLFQAFPTNGRNWIHRDAFWLKFPFQTFYRILCLPVIKDHVSFIGCDHLRPSGNLRIIGFQFFVDGINVRNRISSLRGCSIYHMDDHLGTFNMTQEFKAKANTLGCTFDKSRNICHDKSLCTIQVYHAKMGCDGGEMIIGNFRSGIADLGKQC